VVVNGTLSARSGKIRYNRTMTNRKLYSVFAIIFVAIAVWISPGCERVNSVPMDNTTPVNGTVR
jgi:hypothetical protein